MLLTLIEVLIDERGWNPLATLNLKERFENRHPLTGSFTDKQLEDLRVLQGWTAVSVRDQEITADAVACRILHSSPASPFGCLSSKSHGMVLEKGEVQVPAGIFYDTPLTPYLTKP